MYLSCIQPTIVLKVTWSRKHQPATRISKYLFNNEDFYYYIYYLLILILFEKMPRNLCRYYLFILQTGEKMVRANCFEAAADVLKLNIRHNLVWSNGSWIINLPPSLRRRTEWKTRCQNCNLVLDCNHLTRVKIFSDSCSFSSDTPARTIIQSLKKYFYHWKNIFMFMFN